MSKKKSQADFDISQPNFKMLACKCGRKEKVDNNAKKVQCSYCTALLIPAPAIKEKGKYVPTGKPIGWHWMKEFVDKDGNVFHKGVEQPKLKGTLPITIIETKPKKKRKTKDEKLVALYKHKQKAKKKEEAKFQRELEKQKRFLKHDFDKKVL